MKTLPYCSIIAWRDTLRLRRSLTATIMIIISIGLPLVLLLGLAAGLVKQQEEQMLKSPTTCLVGAWATSGNARPFSKSVEARLLQECPDIACIIPDIKKVVDVRSDQPSRELAGLTLLCTQPGDPLLAFHQADVLSAGEQGIVLACPVADQLGIRYAPHSERQFSVEPGQMVTLLVTRHEADGAHARASVRLEVRAVAALADANIAYADRHLLEWIDDYQQGQAVPELGWPAYTKSASVAYEGYLCFCKEPLASTDLTRFAARGLTAARLDPQDPDHAERCQLAGVLKPHELAVYYLSAGDGLSSTAGLPQLTLTPREVEDISDADDVVLPWSQPLEASLAGSPCRLVGVSLHKRWLRAFFHHPDAGFTLTQSELQVQFPRGGQGPLGATAARLQLPDGQSLHLSLNGFPPPVTPLPPCGIAAMFPVFDPYAPLPAVFSAETFLRPSMPVALVPAEFLAHVHAAEHGGVQYDAALGLFLATPGETEHYHARVYADDLHAVPTVDAYLRQQGYATQSERTRVEEIQRYAHALAFLVHVVGSTVFLFGTWTLFSVLSDNTARKRGTVGILRIMGVSRLGILYIVVVRALLVGAIAGALLLPLSIGLSRLLTSAGAFCELRPTDLMTVAALVLLACLLGVIGPAFKASRLDPVVAVAEANAH